MRRTGPDLATRQGVIDRDRRVCRRCGDPGQEIHHRAARQMGGTQTAWINDPSNLVLLCSPCHHWVTTHPQEAYHTGWSVRRLSCDLPYQIPLRAVDGSEFYLTDEFTVQQLSLPYPDGDDMSKKWGA